MRTQKAYRPLRLRIRPAVYEVRLRCASCGAPGLFEAYGVHQALTMARRVGWRIPDPLPRRFSTSGTPIFCPCCPGSEKEETP